MTTRNLTAQAVNGHAPSPVFQSDAHEPACFHGWAFFEAIGDGFQTLERRHSIINADVLDAWFPPAPGVLEALRAHLGWLVRTSPPTQCEGLVRAIARTRGVPERSILVGGGSSDIIFLALTRWLRPSSRVLLLDPTYGEYAHVLERVVGCRVDRLELARADRFTLRPSQLDRAWSGRYDLVVLVNPNSPTGRHMPGGELADVLSRAPATTRVWVDETYVDYAGANQSLERFVASRPNIVVCKSMSKVYALSGVRAAYLVGAPGIVRDLRRHTPPWAVSLLGQLAAVRALEAPEYYRRRYAETHRLRERLADELTALGFDVTPGVANFLLFHTAESGPCAREIVTACRRHGLFLREAASMSPSLGDRALRIAIKDTATNLRMLVILRSVICSKG